MRTILLLLVPLVLASNMFTFEIACSASASTCANMTATLNSAGARLTAILAISVPIKVSVSLQSFGSGMGGVLGYAGPASYVYGRTNQSRPYTSYAQALVKQIDTNTSYSGYDIAASFNSDFNFYYKSSGTLIASNQYDFEYVACHELTHGLGFIDDLISSFNGNSGTPKFLAPNILVDSTGATFAGWVVPGIFNTYMWDYVKQTNIYSYYETITRTFNPVGQQLSSLDQTFANTTIPFGAAQATLNASTSYQLKFNSAFNSTPVSLYAPSQFAPGSSISHTDYWTFTHSPDFLMLFTIYDATGLSLDTILSQNNYLNGSVYGPSTFALMSSLGWTSVLYKGATTWNAFNASLSGSGTVPTFCWPSTKCPTSSIVPTQTYTSIKPTGGTGTLTEFNSATATASIKYVTVTVTVYV